MNTLRNIYGASAGLGTGHGQAGNGRFWWKLGWRMQRRNSEAITEFRRSSPARNSMSSWKTLRFRMTHGMRLVKGWTTTYLHGNCSTG